MIIPTLFIGIGDFGRKVIDDLRFLATLGTGKHDLYGLFEYGVISLNATNAQYSMEKILGVPEEVRDFEAQFPHRGSVQQQNRAPLDGYVDKICQRFTKNMEDATKRNSRATELAYKLGITSSLEVSGNLNVFLIGNVADNYDSSIIPYVAKRIKQNNVKLLPYGMFNLSEDDNSTGFMYEFYTQMAPKGEPFFNAIYLFDSKKMPGQPDPLNDAVTYTIAKLLFLLQTVLYVPARLVDIDADMGKGNVLVFSFGGALSLIKENSFYNEISKLSELLERSTDEYSVSCNDIEEDIDEIAEYLAMSAVSSAKNNNHVQVKDHLKSVFISKMRREMWKRHKKNIYGPAFAMKVSQCITDSSGRYFGDRGIWKESDESPFKPVHLLHQALTSLIQDDGVITKWLNNLRTVREGVDSLIGRLNNLNNMNIWALNGRLEANITEDQVDELRKNIYREERRQTSSMFKDSGEVKFESVIEWIFEKSVRDGRRENAQNNVHNINYANLQNLFINGTQNRNTPIFQIDDGQKGKEIDNFITEDAKEFKNKVFYNERFYFHLYTGYGYYDFNFTHRPGNKVNDYISVRGEEMLLFMQFIYAILNGSLIAYDSEEKRMILMPPAAGQRQNQQNTVNIRQYFPNQILNKEIDLSNLNLQTLGINANTVNNIRSGVQFNPVLIKMNLVNNLLKSPRQLFFEVLKNLGMQDVPVSTQNIEEFVRKLV